MRKGTQEKANLPAWLQCIYRVVVGVKAGWESWDHMVVGLEHPDEEFIFSSKSHDASECSEQLLGIEEHDQQAN